MASSTITGGNTGTKGEGLAAKRCIPCEKGMPSLDDAAVDKLLGQVTGWGSQVDTPGQPRKLRKTYQFADFLGSMAFVDRIAALAEEEQHHPDFSVSYSRVDVTLWTHEVGGLSENDFILAAKIDAIISCSTR